LFEIKEKQKRSRNRKRKKEKETKNSSKWASPFGLQRREEGTRRLVPDAKGVK
jgi:hypothetical protein